MNVANAVPNKVDAAQLADAARIAAGLDTAEQNITTGTITPISTPAAPVVAPANNGLVSPVVTPTAPITATPATVMPTASQSFSSNLQTINGAPTPTATVNTPSNTVGLVAPPTMDPRTVTEKETVVGQLNTLLNGDSPYIQSARNKGFETANARGLINSSLAAGTSERAAIDAALPIATQDATIEAQAAQSAQQANENIGLTGYKGNIDSAQQSENFNYKTQENNQNIKANTDLQNSRIALDLSRLDTASRDAYESAIQPGITQTTAEIAVIQRTPDSVMTPKAKLEAINYQFALSHSIQTTAAALYGYKIDWTKPETQQEAA